MIYLCLGDVYRMEKSLDFLFNQIKILSDRLISVGESMSLDCHSQDRAGQMPIIHCLLEYRVLFKLEPSLFLRWYLQFSYGEYFRKNSMSSVDSSLNIFFTGCFAVSLNIKKWLQWQFLEIPKYFYILLFLNLFSAQLEQPNLQKISN